MQSPYLLKSPRDRKSCGGVKDHAVADVIEKDGVAPGGGVKDREATLSLEGPNLATTSFQVNEHVMFKM